MHGCVAPRDQRRSAPRASAPATPVLPNPATARVLALDFGQKTGYARFANGAVCGSGTVVLAPAPKKKERPHPGAAFAKLEDFLSAELDTFQPTLLVFEEPYHDIRKRGVTAARQLFGYRAVALMVAARAKCQVWPVEPAAIKMRLLGWLQRKTSNGLREYAKADHVFAAVKAKYPWISGLDEAMAIAVLEVALAEVREMRQLHRAS